MISEATNEVEVAAFAGEDLESYAAFQRRAFRTRLAMVDRAPFQTAAQYRWKYDTPAGPALIARVHRHGELVAAVAAMPMLFRLGHHQLCVHQIVDLASAPEVRGEGVFRRCFEALLDRLGPDRPLYCLPNQHSRRSLEGAGFRALGHLDTWIAAAPRPNPGPLSADDSGFGLDLADRETFAWRFERRPDMVYEIALRRSAGVFVMRRVAVGPVSIPVVMAFHPAMSGDIAALWNWGVSEARAQWPVPILWIGQAPPCGITGFVTLPQLLVGRAFPVFVRAWPAPGVAFQGAEWDVL